MKAFKVIVLAAVVTMLAAPAWAQQGFPPGGQLSGPYEDEQDFAGNPGRRGPGGPASEERLQELGRKIEALRVWRLTEALRLDEKTSGKFFPLLSSIEQQRREISRSERDAMHEIRLSIDSKQSDEKKLKSVLERIERNHREMMKLREREIEMIKDNLTVEQQARYLIFQREFQQEIRRMINQARGGGQGPGMRGGMGPGGPGREP